MQFQQHGRQWETLVGFDVVNDAAVIELRDITNSPMGEVVLCAVKPKETGVVSFEQYRADLPPELINWFRDDANRIWSGNPPEQG